MTVSCPNCGAPVEFRYDDSLVRVCGSCRSAVLRTDRGIETLGKLADVTPIESPLRLFADGYFKGVSFILVGMAQIKHAAGGIWQEWYAKLDGGQWGWLSEAQGRFYMTF
ncbi:MAG: zinc ribbon domain-containing protein, partial [Kofleriaceae bacterium]